MHDHARVFALGDVSGPEEASSYEELGTASQSLNQPATAQVGDLGSAERRAGRGRGEGRGEGGLRPS